MQPKIRLYKYHKIESIPALHFHNDYEIIFVLKGQSSFSVNKKQILAEENSLILFSNMDQHSMQILTDTYERYVLFIDRFYVDHLLPSNVYFKLFIERPEHFPYKFTFDHKTLIKIKNLFQTLYEENEDYPLTSEYLQILVDELLILIYRSNPKYFAKYLTDMEQSILKIQQYILVHYAEDIFLEDLERKFFLSKYTISRTFQEITGFHFKTYIILVRLSIAKDLLVHSHKTIQQISQLVGYHSENHFTKIFKKYESIPPREYRSRYQQMN